MFTLNDVLQGNADDAARPNLLSSRAPDPELVFRAAHHDSRQIEPGDLYVALKGTKVDGHRFIADAARAGALAALCSTPATDLPADFIQIVVPDVVKALHATAHVRALRQQNTIFIGITGSNGKTSTKEAVAAVLSRKAPTLKTQASYNTEIGYPLTLLRLEPQHRYAVLEMGAQWVGELAWLCTIAAPNWSLITTVGAAHLEHFGSQERVAIAKSELVQVLAPDGLAILNYDDPNVRAMHTKTQARVLYYGRSEQADVRASTIGGDTLRGHSFTLHYQGQQARVQLHIPGEQGITIALAAAAAGLAAEIPLEEVAATLETLVPFARRGEMKPGPNGSTIIDDSFNANRPSILAMARAMHEAALDPATRRWAVLGDILQLGSYAQEEHYAVGQELASLVDFVVAIGEQARFYAQGALDAGMPASRVHYYAASPKNRTDLEAAKQAAAQLIKEQVQSEDLVLVKASLGVGMDTLLAMLQEG